MHGLRENKSFTFASPSMRLINPTYSRRQSVTNLISNNNLRYADNLNFVIPQTRTVSYYNRFLPPAI